MSREFLPTRVRTMAGANEAMKDHLESNRIVDEKTGEFWVPERLPPDPGDPDVNLAKIVAKRILASFTGTRAE